MRRSLLFLTFLAMPALAQDAQEDRDRGFIVGLIEDNLSAPGLSVRLDGFEGALSSKASLDVLTISDDAGPWLRLEEVGLDWNRGALLRGRLEVDALTAGLIRVERAPLPAEGVEALPEAGASGFSLPNLPVSVEIDAIRAERIELGAALLGQDLAMTLEASARLVDGSGAVTLQGRRLDGVEGVFDIDAGYEAATQALTIDLAVTEAEGGIAATLLQLPGAPGIALTVLGSGPLDQFSADVAVASDGVDRLAGAITLAGVEQGRRFDLDIGGDVTALVAPRYRPFFGEEVGLRAAGLLRDAGGTELEQLTLETRALRLEGAAAIGADGWPTLLDIEGRLASQDGGPVLLPTATAIQVAGARFVLRHDAEASENWGLDLTVDGVDHPELALSSAQISATGELSRKDGAVDAAFGRVSIDASGLAFVDAALQEAVGAQATLEATVDWRDGAPVRIEDLDLRGPALEATGSVRFDSTAELPVTLNLTARLPELARVAELTGLEALAGAAEMTLEGGVALGGAFDLEVAGEATGLRTGIPQADGLLAGRTDLSVAARRDVTGTHLDRLDLSNPQVSVTGDAAIWAEDAPERARGRTSEADLEIVLDDGSVIDPRLAGETRAVVDLGQDATGAWQGTASIDAPQNVAFRADGVLTGPTADLEFSLAVPDLADFVEGVPGGVTAAGRAFVDDAGLWTVDADATGPYDLTAKVAGRVTGDRPEITYTARLPDPTAAVPALEAVPALAAPVEVSGSLAQEGAAWVTDTRVDGPDGIVMRAQGSVTGPAPRLDVAVTVPEMQAFVAQVEGALSLDGTLAKQGEDWRATLRALGPYAARATAETVLTDTPLAVDFSLAVPELSAVVPTVPGGLDIAGLAVQMPEGWRVDVTGTGPYDAALEVIARLPEAGPEVDATIRVPDASVIAAALEGPLTVEAQALQRNGIWSADLDAAGPFGSTATARAVLPPDGAAVTADIRVPNVGALDPRLSGPLTVDLDARQVAGVWEADLDAAGPLDATVSAMARLPAEGAQVIADVRIPDSSVLSPRLRGPLTADLDATQSAGVWSVDFDAALPFNGTAIGTARLDGQDAEADLRLRLPDSSVIAPQLNGAMDADVIARQVDGVWTIDVDSQGPFGGTIAAEARVAPEGITADATVSLPDSRRVAPQLSGPIRATAQARQVNGAWTVTADSQGPFRGTASVRAVLEEATSNVVANLRVPDSSVLVPQLSGPLTARVDATQRGSVWRADVDANGPLGASVGVSGVVAGAPVAVDVAFTMPDVSPLVADLSGPLRASGRVNQVGAAYRLALDVGGPSGAQADVAGTVATDGTLALNMNGSAPLGLANAIIEPRRLAGTARFDLAVNGPPALESVTGTITTQGAALALPTLRNDLDPIDTTIRLTGGQAVIDLRAGVGSGGDVTVSGPVSLAAPFNADLAVRFDGTVADPNLYSARVTAEIAVTGPLTGGAAISGDILIPEAEIAVPSTGITSVGELPPIDHMGTTRPVQRTLARAGQDAASRASAEVAAASGPAYTLNVVLRAPGQIFVRGRGLDAELGGRLSLTGTTANPVTAGGFELIRGRLDILQQRFDLDEGAISFQGDLIPFIRLVAETETDTLTAAIVVEGPADDIKVSFESSPEAPDEEILAQIFFGRDLSELSPLQALQLANSVAVLAGRSSGGLLQRLRGDAGLDDLDVTTDADGNTAVRAGKYVSDNVYTSVEIDQEGDAAISLNIDLTPNLTLRGTTGASGNSSVGIFFEKDY